MKYKKEYVFADDLFDQMDSYYWRQEAGLKSQIAVWGERQELEKAGEIKQIDFYISDQSGSLFEKEIRTIKEIVNWTDLFICVIGQDCSKKIDFLKNKNLGQDACIIGNQFIKWLPSKMMKITLYDQPIKNFHCVQGMKKVDFSGNGNMLSCCGARISPVIGNLFHDTTIREEWDSYKSRIVKLSLVNHTFSFCSKEKCAGMAANKDHFIYRDLEYADADYNNKGEMYPPLATICIDYTCNLKCESCRKDYKKASNEELTKRKFLAEKLRTQLMDHVEQVIMAGNGEMFYSELYRDMWIHTSAVKRKGIIVKSNGILFHERNWNLLKQGYEEISLDISIDGASKNVYEEVRRGGNWAVLKRNMEFAGKLKKNGEIKKFNIEFVVQKKNYMDAKKFVELGRQWGCDEVVFARIYNWGTYEDDFFNREVTLFERNGTGKIKEEYREYFLDQIFDDPIVRGIHVFRV